MFRSPPNKHPKQYSPTVEERLQSLFNGLDGLAKYSFLGFDGFIDQRNYSDCHRFRLSKWVGHLIWTDRRTLLCLLGPHRVRYFGTDFTLRRIVSNNHQ